MYKLIAFDLDGTVADTLADLAASVNHALSLHNLPAYPEEDYKHFVGNGVDNLIKNVLNEYYNPGLAEEVKAEFAMYYAGHSMDYTGSYPGMAELLSRLSADGIMTAVISNKPDAFVPAILGELYPSHCFDYISGQREGVARKPAPDALLSLLDKLKTAKEDTLYVGDSDVDVIFAHNAGVKVCGVGWGFRGTDELRAAGADRIAQTMQELTDIIYE